MRAVIQRVSRAGVTVNGATVGEIRSGILLLVGVASGDSNADVDALAAKVVGLRIFADDDGKMNRSLSDTRGSILVVSQFTLQADIRRGRRPSFTSAAQPAKAEPLIERLCEGFRSLGLGVAEGQFGANMEVALVNDGPVTIVLDTLDGQVV